MPDETTIQWCVIVLALVICAISFALVAWMLFAEPGDEHDIETTPEENDLWPHTET